MLQRLLPAFSVCMCLTTMAQPGDPYKPSFDAPAEKAGYKLVWHDEFDMDGKPDSDNWKFENGFVRNEELQWYQPGNATCANGVLVIEGRREQVKNNNHQPGATDWRLNRPFAEYTSASLKTSGLHQWLFGVFEIRARIDTAKGSWPAIWTLGINGEWPSNGEIDLMEFYRVDHQPTVLANTAWGTAKRYTAKWNTKRIPLAYFTAKDSNWINKFHVWKMEWTKDAIKLFLDDELLNTTVLTTTVNPNGINPFLQPHFLLLNLALGGNGEDPDAATNLVKYEVDYVRVYQPKER
ncbi:glycoside hydrolase family 16 protein [Panacibacter sp. DH6]|uniref:Glycoside hydrolase family 16 protein n=2 Tax=Panacibacter microcysteis TaxID=2793269 RepID=A0A931GZV5_9BACT|nr:glycoside hydrolase family 16 protein [Panacibacter microcysteis]